MFVCKICGNEVKAGQAFCPKCGADVVENYETVCPACGSKNTSGSRYCAKCGGILSVMRKPVCAVCGAKNLPGAKFCVSCGAPIVVDGETHSDADMLDARKVKLRLDNMERERMAVVDKEIAEKRAKALEEKEAGLKEVEDYRAKVEEELDKREATLEAYREKLNELGSEDVELLKKMSVALKNYSVYYADPYSQIDEDDIEGDTYVCPACGTVNPLNVTACSHCGRNKARALLLLAKNKIKQSPPIKRKQGIIPAPEQDLKFKKTPTYDEFANGEGQQTEEPAAKQEEVSAEKKEQPSDFSGPGTHFAGYPFAPYAYPYAPQMPIAGAPGGFFVGKDGEPYQMPPIVQPVAFVPYVTQEQPLMQYSPAIEEQAQPAQMTVQPQQAPPVQTKQSGRRKSRSKKQI